MCVRNSKHPSTTSNKSHNHTITQCDATTNKHQIAYKISFGPYHAPLPPPHDTHLQLLSDGVCYPLEQVNCTLVTTQVHLSCWDAEDGLGPGTPAIIVLDHLDFIYHSYVDYSVCVCVGGGGGGGARRKNCVTESHAGLVGFFFLFYFRSHVSAMCSRAHSTVHARWPAGISLSPLANSCSSPVSKSHGTP